MKRTAIVLLDAVSALLRDAFAAEGLDPALGRAVPSARPDLGDFQCTGAMAAAKAAKKNPQLIAKAIVERLSGHPLLAEVTIAGPGFINLRLKNEAVAGFADQSLNDPSGRLGMAPVATPQTILLDFGGPNVAKALHVGHLRSAVIGESLRRILSFLGHKTISDTHLGDWGTPMGMLLDGLRREHPEWPYFDDSITSGYPEQAPVTLADLERLYPQAAAACKADPARAEAARLATLELQSGRAGYRVLWRAMVEVSLAAIRAQFARLGAHFDLYLGESDSHPEIGPMLSDLKARGLAIESQGAQVIEVAQDSDKAPMPPLIIEKADGAALYATTDLATIVARVRDHQPQRILYVVDQRQSLQLEQVFRAAAKAGYSQNVSLTHVPFGTVNGPDNKPFKTRDGGVMRLTDLLDMTIRAAEQRVRGNESEDADPAEIRAKAERIGVAALKFADLSTDRISGYVFDPERMTAFEGKTGPYLQYAAVRAAAVLAKAGSTGEGAAITLTAPEERELILSCLALPDAIAEAAQKLGPDAIADRLFLIAQAFSRFYAQCPVASAEDPAVRASRLRLTALVGRSLRLGLDLLGIDVPAAM